MKMENVHGDGIFCIREGSMPVDGDLDVPRVACDDESHCYDPQPSVPPTPYSAHHAVELAAVRLRYRDEIHRLQQSHRAELETLELELITTKEALSVSQIRVKELESRLQQYTTPPSTSSSMTPRSNLVPGKFLSSFRPSQ
jgi:hypothetical protein